MTLTALSIDRYLAIKAPSTRTNLARMTGHCGKVPAVATIILLWVLAGCILTPVLFVRSVITLPFQDFNITFYYCIEKWSRFHNWRRVYGVTLLAGTYIVPIIIIATCYCMMGKVLCSDEFQRQTSDANSTLTIGRKKVARMLIAVIGVFIVCWLPYNAISLRLDWYYNYSDAQILPFTLWLGHVHCAVNPVLYWFLNRSFRHSMKRVLKCQHGRRSRRDTPSPQYVLCGI